MEQVLSENTVGSVMTNDGEENSKNSKSFIAVLIFCTVLAIGGVVFGVCGMLTAGNKNAETTRLRDEIIEKDKVIADLKSSKSSKSDMVEPMANSYNVFADRLAQAPARSVFGYYYHYTGSDNVLRTMSAQIDEGNHLTVTDLEDGNRVIAGADDVISVYFVYLGNGSTPYFYILNEAGEVFRICIAENANRTIERLGDYDRIVSVFEGGDLYVWLVDIDGNTYKTD